MIVGGWVTLWGWVEFSGAAPFTFFVRDAGFRPTPRLRVGHTR